MKLKTLEEKDLIRLIKDELVHIRLINGLELLGLNADNYHLNLNETIFKLAGIEADNEDFFDRYIEKCLTVNDIDIFKHPELLNNTAIRLCNELKKEYKAQKHKK